MCQTIVYLVEEGKEVPILEDVVNILPGDGAISMVNLFGEEKVVFGRIKRIDLLVHRVIIESGGGK
jgi:predicted RNA-binding protein